MLILVAGWIIGGMAFMLGCRWLLHVKLAKYDHEERMAEIDLQRARLDEEIAQGRADRASRTRPDLAAIDAATEVFPPVPASDAGDPVDELVDQEPEHANHGDAIAEPAEAGEWPSAQDNDAADDAGHWLPTPL